MTKAPKTAAERLKALDEHNRQAKAEADRLAAACSEEERHEVYLRLRAAHAQETLTEGIIEMLQHVGSHHSVAPYAAGQAAAVRELTEQAFEVAAKGTARLVAQDEARQAKERSRRKKIADAKIGKKKVPVMFAAAYEMADKIKARHPSLSAAAVLTKLERDLPAGTDIPTERQLRRHFNV